MYICKLCGKNSEANQKAFLTVLKTRLKKYPFRANANKIRDLEEDKWKFIPDNGGEGFETVKEVTSCLECHQKNKNII